MFFLVPLPPCCLNITEEYHDTMATTVTLDWDPPQGSGPQTIVDNYTIAISPAPLYQPGVNIVSSPPWNVTLMHNEVYIINVTASNCAGESEIFMPQNITFSKNIIFPCFEFILICAVNCGDPMKPINGSLGPYDHAREGATVTYQCDQGFRPSLLMTSTCTSTAHWMPPPEMHMCTLVTGLVTL